MGIRFFCPNGHKLNVKSFLAGQTGICPYCGIKVDIPLQSTRSASRKEGEGQDVLAATAASSAAGTVAAPAKQPAPAAPVEQPAAPARPAGGSFPTAQPSAVDPFVPAMPVLSAPTPAFDFLTAPTAAGPSVPSGPAAAPPPPPAASFGPPDPLAEAPDAVWYVRPGSGGQYGPAAPSVMRSWIHEGRIAADSLVWREGWQDWREAGKTFPQLLGDAAPAFPQPHAPSAGPAHGGRIGTSGAGTMDFSHQPGPQVVVVGATKSVGISIILTILFGPLGLLYSTVIGGLLMMVISAAVGVSTFGLGLVVTQPICIIWGAVAASLHNRKLNRGIRSAVGQGQSPAAAVHSQRIDAKQKAKNSQMLVIAGLVLAVVILVGVLIWVSWPPPESGKADSGKAGDKPAVEATVKSDPKSAAEKRLSKLLPRTPAPSP